MRMVKTLVSIPAPLKAKLDLVRRYGYTVSGYIRALIEVDLREREARGILKTSHKSKRKAGAR